MYMQCKYRSYLLLVLVLSSGSTVHAQDTSSLSHLIPDLNAWKAAFPVEKVYLHTDKPFYALGDTIWFKAYVTAGSRSRPSTVSKALYVELISGSDSLVKRLKLPVTAGTAKGDFHLPIALTAGDYRLRAYTRWMRNAGAEYFYEFMVPVGNAVSNPVAELRFEQRIAEGKHVLAVIEAADKKGAERIFSVEPPFGKADVAFFPEGGDLINNLPSRVAFKITEPDGFGKEASGFILNEEQDTLSTFTTVHAGMGFFNLTPRPGRKYHAWIHYPNGTRDSVPLPNVRKQGYVLWAYPYLDKDTLLVRVMAGDNQFLPVSLLAQNNGELLYAASLQINQPLTSIRIPTRDFPSGITQLTLFDAQNRPLCERLVFFRKADTLQLAVSIEKSVLKTRGHMEIELAAAASDHFPVIGDFSVSVTDEGVVPRKNIIENTIFSNLLLSSDLPGYIEDPAYYFRNNTLETNQHLDLLMMTHGYRRFIWRDLLNGHLPSPKYPAEDFFTPVSGVLLNLGGKQVKNGKVTLFSVAAGLIRDTITDKQGRFNFGNLLIGENVSFSVQGRTARGGRKVEVVMDSLILPAPIVPNHYAVRQHRQVWQRMQPYLTNIKAVFKQLEEHGMTERINMLKGVTVTAPGEDDLTSEGIYAIPSGHADQTIEIENLAACPTLLQCLRGRLHGVTFRLVRGVTIPYSREERMVVIVDGRKISNENELAGVFNGNLIDPADVVQVEVVRTNIALINMLKDPVGIAGQQDAATGGAILIKTDRGSRQISNSPDIKLFSPPGFYIAREFYSPVYDKSQEKTLADLRSTIYWDPSVITAENGKATFDFYNSDRPGTYRIILEGISHTGQLGRLVYRYEVLP